MNIRAWYANSRLSGVFLHGIFKEMSADDTKKKKAMKKAGKRPIFIPALLVLLLGIAVGFAAGRWMRQQRAESTPFSLTDIPEWSGQPAFELPGAPSFTEEEITQTCFIRFSEMDALGRCGTAFACVGPESMPEGTRGSIGMIKPAGWQSDKYEFIDNGGFIYNRCHLLAWKLTGENDEPRNLITGTRYLNTQGMLPYENRIIYYIQDTGNHVMYRVTPVYREGELLARGVHMEARSVEDGGRGILFNVYCYNVQPYITIDYMTGKNHVADDADPEEIAALTAQLHPENENGAEGQLSGSAGSQTGDSENGQSGGSGNGQAGPYTPPEDVTYILNTSSRKFHYPDCPSVQDMQPHNRQEFRGTREEAVAQGYEPCGACKP